MRALRSEMNLRALKFCMTIPLATFALQSKFIKVEYSSGGGVGAEIFSCLKIYLKHFYYSQNYLR